MSKQRITWIVGKMHFPPDVNPADIDWVEPMVKPRKETEQKSLEPVTVP